MRISFGVRVFLTTFLPAAALLSVSFILVRYFLLNGIKENLRNTLLTSHEFIGRTQANIESQNTRLLSVLAESPSLKAGMELVRQYRAKDGEPVRPTLDSLLADLIRTSGFELAVVADGNGKPVAGVIRTSSGTESLVLGEKEFRPGMVAAGDRIFYISSVPITIGDEPTGELIVGRPFDFGDFLVPTLLLKDGRLVKSNVGYAESEVQKAIAHCRPNIDCDLRLGHENFLSVPIRRFQLGNGYSLRSLESVDQAAGGLSRRLEKLFGAAGAVTLATFLIVATASARSVVRPVTALVENLRQSEISGSLSPLSVPGEIPEIEDLARAFNRATEAVTRAHSRLTLAHKEFVQAITNALDARDVYTAGHSFRVSEYSCAIAARMGISGAQIEVLRVGALVHDVGKIGVPDQVLRKAGPLSAAEFSIIRRHPTIGRRILENVEGFQSYLDIVELHHENFDGTGYPLGLAGSEIPLDARIVHVADAYDAMTSDRPYRKGMSHEEACYQIRKYAGTQFDPVVAAAFLNLDSVHLAEMSNQATGDLARLAVAVEVRGIEIDSEVSS